MRITVPLAIVVLTVALALVILGLVLAGLAAAGGAIDPPLPTQTASPGPLPTVSPTIDPPAPAWATPAQKHWALRWYHAAVRAHRPYVSACEALGIHPRSVTRLAFYDDRANVLASGRKWRTEALFFRSQLARLELRLRHPGGGGAARWWPAARYCGWPAHLKGWFCYIVWRESSARAHAVNASSGCYGLLQLHPCHWASKGLAWISDPLNQLRLGWQLYRQCGPSPWAL